MTTAQLEGEATSEADVVLRWRFDELIRAGYDHDDAELIARDLMVDLHLATDLVRQGCPSAIAVRIAL
jgi:hypothetical protein